MANARAIKNRIKTVKNTGKITKTMAMVSTAKATKAVTQIKNSRTYSDKLYGMLETLGSACEMHPLFQANEEAPKTLVVAITSNRGLCGGYNANIVRLAKQETGDNTDVIMFGKKGGGAFRFAKIDLHELRTDLGDIPSFEFAAELADQLIDVYEKGEYSQIKFVYSKYLSAGSQQPVVESLLPLSSSSSEEDDKGLVAMEPLFSPNKNDILLTLVPKIVRLTVYKFMLDAIASEHLARQLAMNSASDNANDMAKALSLTYNRARQAQITTELSEIVGGAAALD